MTTFRSLIAVFALAAGIVAPPAAFAQPAGVLRVSAIPDEAPTELQRKFKPLGDYLAKATGLKVEFTPVTDYAASVEGLINKKIDMVWFGGFTFVQANARSKGMVTPLVQRAEDEKFRSVFITTNKDINKLEDLKGKTLSFGSESSTSGHLMPRSYLLAAKINPDTDLKRIAFLLEVASEPGYRVRGDLFFRDGAVTRRATERAIEYRDAPAVDAKGKAVRDRANRSIGF